MQSSFCVGMACHCGQFVIVVVRHEHYCDIIIAIEVKFHKWVVYAIYLRESMLFFLKKKSLLNMKRTH